MFEQLKSKCDRNVIIVIICAIIAIVTCSTSFGERAFVLSVWIWPALMIYISRSNSKKNGILSVLVMLFISMVIAEFSVGVDLIHPVVLIIALLLLSIIVAIPFIIDRLLCEKMNDIQRLFMFPCLWVVIEMLLSLITPLGDFYTIAYSQAAFLPIVQSVSVIGTFGLAFLICMFATSVNLLVEKGVTLRKTDYRAVGCIAAILIVIVASGVRFAVDDVDPGRVTVATFSGPCNCYYNSDVVVTYEMDIDFFNRSTDYVIEYMQEGNDVDIICTSEEAYALESKDYERFSDYIEQNALAIGVDILWGYGIVDESHEKIISNRCDFVTKNGVTQWTYVKTKLVPIDEKYTIPGDGIMHYTDTEYGRVSSLICYDMEYPIYTNNVDSHVDILLSPSWDWHGLENWHTRNMSFRAVENGFNFVRATENGTIGYYDWKGNCYGTFDNPTSEDCPAFISSIPNHGAVTFYGQFGMFVNILFVIGLVATFVPFVITYISRKKGE